MAPLGYRSAVLADVSGADSMKPSRTSGLFITGTDTGVGKTLVAQGLIRALRRRDIKVAPMKPIASGCILGAEGLRNDDAEALIEAAGGGYAYEDVNPFAYQPAIAPHLAAAESGRPIDVEQIVCSYDRLASNADMVVVEGAGGWRVPIDAQRNLAEIAQRLQLGVVLVVGVRLGCLNHALLSAEAILADGCELIGWVANLISPQDLQSSAQVETLRQRLPAPLLTVLPWVERPDAASDVASRFEHVIDLVL